MSYYELLRASIKPYLLPLFVLAVMVSLILVIRWFCNKRKSASYQVIKGTNNSSDSVLNLNDGTLTKGGKTEKHGCVLVTSIEQFKHSATIIKINGLGSDLDKTDEIFYVGVNQIKFKTPLDEGDIIEVINPRGCLLCRWATIIEVIIAALIAGLLIEMIRKLI